MNELLKRTPMPLTDERKAMFLLMDQFFGAVERYRKQYAAIVEQRDRDVRDRTKNMEDTLRRLRETYEDSNRKQQSEFNSKIQQIQEAIQKCGVDAANEVSNIEKRYSEQSHGVRVKLEQDLALTSAQLGDYRGVAEEIRQIVDRLGVILGKGIGKKSRIEKIRETGSIDGTVSSVSQALEAVARDRATDAWALYNEVQGIVESLPRKLFLGKKRDKAIASLLSIADKAGSGVALLERDCHFQQEQFQINADEKLRQLQSGLVAAKDAIQKRKDQAIASRNQEKENVKSQHQKETAKLRQEHEHTYSQQKTYLENQIAQAQKNWRDQLEQCSKAFDAEMETEFPSKAMDGWLGAFWYHPWDMAQYKYVKDFQLNTMIGVAAISIKSWYEGDTGAVIRNVLLRYPRMFGKDQKSIEAAFKGRYVQLPYCLSVEEGTSLLISHEDACADRARRIVNSIGMRLVRSVPPCMMRFDLIDANGVGTFGELLSLDPANKNNPAEPTVKSFAIGENVRVHSSVTDIAEQIEDAKVKMDDLAAALANHASIRVFNQKNPLSTMIYRQFLMMNYPFGLGEHELRTLSIMASTCARMGFSLVAAQPDKHLNELKKELKPLVQDLNGHMVCMRMVDKSPYLRVMASPFMTERAAAIQLFDLPRPDELEQAAKEIRAQSVEASRLLIRFIDAKDICPPKEQWFKEKADDGIVIPIGYYDGGDPFKLQLDDAHVNTLVLGNIGSGKSNLLHVLMTSIMLRYSADDVQLYLVDFKYGQDFRVYTQYNLPSFRAISINNDPEFVLAMLTEFEHVQNERSQLMEGRYQKISEYNHDHPENRLKRYVLVIDELYVFLNKASEEVRKGVLEKIDTFAHQTRAFGIHLVICGQDLDKIDKFENIRNQCTNRLALHCSDEQVKYIMEDSAVARMHALDATDRGACVCSTTRGSRPTTEHTAYLGPDQLAELLGAIQEHYTSQKIFTNVKVLMTKVADDPNHPIQRFVAGGMLPELRKDQLLVGEPVSMTRSLQLIPQKHLWVVGGISEESVNAGNSLVFFAALSLLLSSLSRGTQQLLCTNCADSPLRTPDEEEKDLISQLLPNYQDHIGYTKGEQLTEVLQMVLDELDSRKQDPGQMHPPLWWLLVRPDLMPEATDSSFVISFKELLSEADKYGIHVLLWTTDLRMAKKMQIEQNMFGDVICLEQAPEDVRTICGREIKPPPTGFKAIHIGNNTMPFRIYDQPNGNWMNRLAWQLDQMTKTK